MDPDTTDDGVYSIGEIAEEFGLSHRALRFYERKGLVAPRRQGQKRIYSARDRARIQLVAQAKKQGFSLMEIRDLISQDRGGNDVLRVTPEQCLVQIEMLERRKREVEEALTELHRIYRNLSGGAASG